MISTDATIEESIEELQPVIDAVDDAVHLLDEQDKFIVNALNSEQISYEALGKRLGVSKTHAWRLTAVVYARLHVLLKVKPIIQKRIIMPKTWNDSAGEWVALISTLAMKESPANIDELNRLIDKARRAIMDYREEPIPLLWTEIASHALQELRMNNKWDITTMSNLLVSKQRDYGHGNIMKFGLTGILIRLNDKIERLGNLRRKNVIEPKNESIDDTLKDIIGYCVVALMYTDRTFELELSSNEN